MLDYKNNILKYPYQIDESIESIQFEKNILGKKITLIKKQLKDLGASVKQATLYDFYNGFMELSAYEIDEILCAGEKPYSLFMQDEIISELKNIGVTTIINLMQKHEFNMYNIEPIDKEFKVINIEILDNTIPSLDTIYKILYVINNNKKTYIHCNLGLGRTGVIVGYYLSKKYGYRGKSLLQKIEELKADSQLNKKNSPITKEQINFLLKI